MTAAEHVEKLAFHEGAVVIETRDPDACYDLIGAVVVDEEIPIQSLTSPDNSLSAVFEYLTNTRGAE